MRNFPETVFLNLLGSLISFGKDILINQFKKEKIDFNEEAIIKFLPDFNSNNIENLYQS